MDLLVSTPLQILFVNVETKLAHPLRSGDGYYFGITANKDTIALVSFLGYLKFFGPKSRKYRSINHLIEPHQIEWIDDKVLAANTGRNCLSVFNENGEWIRDIYFNNIRYDKKGEDRSGNHFNSIHRFGEKVFVLAHNNNRPSQLWELDWPGLDMVGVKEGNAYWAHNIWLGERGCVICDSKNGTLYELTSQKTIWQQPGDNKWLTRGLCVSENHIIVGYSQHSERKDRYWNNGGIWVIDRKSLKTLDAISLPGTGQVYDIRLVDMLDECHNEHIITSEMVSRIRKNNPILNFAYNLRKRYPSLQKNVPIVSQLLRGRQILNGWRRST